MKIISDFEQKYGKHDVPNTKRKSQTFHLDILQ